MQHLLFVCVENSCRSQMAEAFARMHGHGACTAYSAGSKPSGRVNAKAIAALAEVGYDLGAHHSKGLTQLPAVDYAAVITMGCGDACPAVSGHRREDWPIPDPKQMSPAEFAQVRDLIENKVKDLLLRLPG